MHDEDGFLRAILVAPEDVTLRLVYADWLEERGDPRAEFLRIEAESERFNREGRAAADLQRRLRELEAILDPAWLAFLITLGRPFRTGPVSPDFFICDPSQLPFTEPIGMRGRVFTFESQFRSDHSWEPSLPRDLQLLSQLELGDCYYGAASFPVHPFICETIAARRPRTAADVLATLRARDFRSRHIQSLEATRIPFPGYHPSGGAGIDNDEIHNDFAEQHIFAKGDEDSPEVVDELSGSHGLLKRSVVDGQLWYVLLHIAPEQVEEFLFSHYVVLFAVGRSKSGARLIGVVTHQVCHNLCD